MQKNPVNGLKEWHEMAWEERKAGLEAENGQTQSETRGSQLKGSWMMVGRIWTAIQGLQVPSPIAL
jgi:hypothetical protein